MYALVTHTLSRKNLLTKLFFVVGQHKALPIEAGQALIEGLLSCSVLLALVFCLNQLGVLQALVAQLYSKSSADAFQWAKGGLATRVQVSTFASSAGHEAPGQTLPFEFGTQVPGLLTPLQRGKAIALAQQHRSVLLTLGITRLKRSTVIMGRESYAATPLQVHQQLRTNKVLWTTSGLVSQMIAKKFIPSATATDRPWGREPLTSDWLTRWEDVVPRSHSSKN